MKGEVYIGTRQVGKQEHSSSHFKSDIEKRLGSYFSPVTVKKDLGR